MAVTPAESPREKFDRISEKRLAGVEDAVRLLANLANPYVYEYDLADKQAAFDRILKALEAAEQRFNDGLRRQERIRPRREEAAHGQVRKFRDTAR